MGIINNIIKLKCPKCRKGKMFTHKNYLNWKNILTMYKNCNVCGLQFELENGFWWGTGYVNYIFSALLSGISCILWCIFLGFNTENYSILIWLTFNCILILILQPWIMRIGRAIYIHCFIFYDKNYLKPKSSN